MLSHNCHQILQLICFVFNRKMFRVEYSVKNQRPETILTIFQETSPVFLIFYTFSDTVFGCPLSKLCSRQRVSVPRVITDCIEAIEYRGLKSGGIYRISGNSASIQKLRYWT